MRIKRKASVALEYVIVASLIGFGTIGLASKFNDAREDLVEEFTKELPKQIKAKSEKKIEFKKELPKEDLTFNQLP